VTALAVAVDGAGIHPQLVGDEVEHHRRRARQIIGHETEEAQRAKLKSNAKPIRIAPLTVDLAQIGRRQREVSAKVVPRNLISKTLPAFLVSRRE
jgi:hypothetical protein